MIKFLPILINLVLGTLMLLLGFKVLAPKFPSEEVKATFYKRWSAFLIIAGFVILGATAFLLAKMF
ncbi:hypothetical protein [Chryseolinea soli]|uniref:Uncharacterized protein n=1 Tax=Chryseolinea soli TaxID=2321403 RepID=A0A385SMS1_9BACT|nr:hypothetical protein [Chryseolinea soli]AYB32489.1 hypothetical protein D4L85_18760 [Chryseolinea soli]